MLETSARLLALLSLLQSRPAWSGPELSDRLEVSTRTVRNDIERLRSLGYPVDAERGPTGHYRLGAGAKLPPLILDDEEAVGLAVALRVAAGVAGIEETAARTLCQARTGASAPVASQSLGDPVRRVARPRQHRLRAPSRRVRRRADRPSNVADKVTSTLL